MISACIHPCRLTQERHDLFVFRWHPVCVLAILTDILHSFASSLRQRDVVLKHHFVLLIMSFAFSAISHLLLLMQQLMAWQFLCPERYGIQLPFSG
jgi:hypothetical protein